MTVAVKWRKRRKCRCATSCHGSVSPRARYALTTLRRALSRRGVNSVKRIRGRGPPRPRTRMLAGRSVHRVTIRLRNLPTRARTRTFRGGSAMNAKRPARPVRARAAGRKRPNGHSSTSSTTRRRATRATPDSRPRRRVRWPIHRSVFPARSVSVGPGAGAGPGRGLGGSSLRGGVHPARPPGP